MVSLALPTKDSTLTKYSGMHIQAPLASTTAILWQDITADITGKVARWTGGACTKHGAQAGRRGRQVSIYISRRCGREASGFVANAKDSFLSYRTSQYKLHYYETPTNIKFVMLTDIRSGSMEEIEV